MTVKPHKDAHLFPDVPDELIHDFAAVRKAKRAPITATAVKGIQREADKAGMTLEQALTMCVERNWQGFNAQWVLRVAEGGQSGSAARPGKFDPVAHVNKGRTTGKDWDDGIIDITPR